MNNGSGTGQASRSQARFARQMAAEKETDRQDYGDRKRALFSGLHGDILEIGAGTGPNLEYYPHDVRWIGIEPNPAMFPYLQDEARRLGMTIQLRAGTAERLDVPDNSVDAVVGTLVLCSVSDPARVLQEIRRVLKPGGRYIFIEHVAAPQRTFLRGVQRIVRPIWKAFSDGCHLDRETWTTIEKAGFSRVELDHFRVSPALYAPHISGFAVK